MRKSSRIGLNEVSIGALEFPQSVLEDSYPSNLRSDIDVRPLTANISEAENDYTPSQKQFHVSQTSASFVMFDAMNG